MPLVSWQSCLTAGALFLNHATAFTGSEYALSYEYSGTNFFDGWDFYSGRDPTGGFVTYYSRSSAQLTGLISTSDSGPAYMGVNYVDKLPFNNQTGQGDGAGRPSVRIASKQAFTHGLFIGDFEHIPAGICGTWPAFWTLGPNWPYTGEIDILEGVNQNMNNIMSLHTNETCLIEGDSSVMTGKLGNTNCAYYPDYNVGCGVTDNHNTSFGVGFNQAGGGVYAMQWTSEYIRIWQWSRADVPSDVSDAQPDPSSWGLPAGQLAVGNCSVDQHFQSHKIVFDTTFCGEYAGNPYVWNTSDANSCQASTGLATCDNFVANNPAAFKDAYWSVNYVRVFQLLDPAINDTGTPYIASEQPTNTATNAYTAPNAVTTPNLDADSLCPHYNFSIITDGKYQYEIACDFDPPGPDIIGDPYPGFRANSLADCIKGCTYMNENNGTNKCGGVSHYAAINFCYFKKYIDGNFNYRPGYNEIRLIYYGYPQITDDPRSVADSTLTSIFIETIPTPQTYRPSTITNTSNSTTTTTGASTTISTTIAAPPMGDNSTSTTTSVPPDYSETVTSGYLNSTRTRTSPPSSVASTDPSVTDSDFYIVFNVDTPARRLAKREVQYLAFNDEGQSILVTDQTEAAKFRLNSNGMLMSGQQYVGIDSTVQPPRFLLSDDEPETPAQVVVDEDSNVNVQGVDGYCLTSDGELAVSTDSQELPDDCAVVNPEFIATPGNLTSTSTTGATTPSSTDMESTTSSSTAETTSSLTSIEGLSVTTMTSTTVMRTSSNSDSSTTQNTNISSTTTISSSAATTSTSAMTTTTAQTINDFVYAGCFGVPANAASLSGISAPFTDAAMTNEECTKYCGEQNAYYAGTYDTKCFCGTDEELYEELLYYPDTNCNKPCPGANRDVCGGEVDFQGAIPTTSTSPLGKRAKLDRRQSTIFLISLYNNTLLLGGAGAGDVSTTTSTTGTANDTVTDTITTRPTGTDDPFLTASISYNVTGTNTATVISTTYVDVCHVCEGGLTTKATTITIPHCGCTASYDAEIGHSVSVPSPVVPMLTRTKACACGHAGAQSTITVTVPHTSSIAQLSAQLPPLSTIAAAASPGEIGAMQSPALADAGHNAVNAPSINTEPTENAENVAPTAPAKESTDDDSTESDNNDVAPADVVAESVPEANDVPLTSVAGEGTESEGDSPVNAGMDDTNIAAAYAAPASSPRPEGASNTAVPTGISNYTAQVWPGGNGSFTGSGPIASFTSDGSFLVRFSADRIAMLGENRFMLSLVIAIILGSLVGMW